ncbi:ribonuclease H-like domain-containing protein [Tanacetum coccineum]
MIVPVVVFPQGFIGNRTAWILRNWLLPQCIPHDGCGLAKESLFVGAHGFKGKLDSGDFVGDFYENSEFNFEVEDLPVNTVRSLNKSVEPTCYNDAILDNKWIDAMNAEIEALNKNHTWIFTNLPANRKPIGCKWIFKIKYKSNGEIERYKERLIAKDLEEDVYMKIPQGFSDKDNKNKSPNDHSLCTKSKDNKSIALLVYVDDIVVTGNYVKEIDQFKTFLNYKFNIKDLGSLK